MKRKITVTLLVLAILTGAIFLYNNPNQGGAYITNILPSNYEATIKRDVLCLMLAYPEQIKDIEKTGGNKVYIVLNSGVKLIYDDEKQKNAEGKMVSPDLQDMLEQPYPLITTGKLMEKDFDPGRVRVYPLLKETYGGSKQGVETNLTNVKVSGRIFQFNGQNGAGAALKSVMQELIPLAQSNSKVAAAAFPSSGTYNYRVISGTNRLSPHAFGIAIDLARDKRDYWQWASREDGQKRLNTYPKEIVELFERHNFVWGGKWGHFDILHFEYRPEIILKARYFSEETKAGEPWYKGVPEDEKIKELIKRIDEVI